MGVSSFNGKGSSATALSRRNLVDLGANLSSQRCNRRFKEDQEAREVGQKEEDDLMVVNLTKNTF